MSGQALLSPYRVLDLTDSKGYFCGKALAYLGADVIKIEPPGGDPDRATGPFYGDDPHPEKSLHWFAHNTNKRGITLDIESSDGREIFKRLVGTADVVIESFEPGHLASLGLGWEELEAINPAIILASITGFGQSGPYAHYKAPDIVTCAMGGQMHHTGEPQGQPVRVSVPQAYLDAAADAAVGVMIALWHRRRTGRGQRVDASAQRSMLWFASYGICHWLTQGTLLTRVGALRAGLQRGKVVRQIWACQDGFVCFTLIGGKSGAKSNRLLTEWMREEGFADDFLRAIVWDELDMATCAAETVSEIERRIGAFFAARTKTVLYEGAIQRHIMLYPLATPRGLMEDVQLRSRAYWVDLEHPELKALISYPGAFAKVSRGACGPKRRAPLIGEHNREIYAELGMSAQTLTMLREARVI